MKSLFGSIKNACNSAKQAVSKAVTKVKNTVQKFGGEVKKALCKGAKVVKNAVVAGTKVLKAKCKSAMMWLIKKTTKTIGMLYHKLWESGLRPFLNDKLLSLMPGGFIIRGLNYIGATNFQPLDWMAKGLARLAFTALDGVCSFIQKTTGVDAKKFATETFMFGFKYDYKQGITYTDPNAPQKYAGYTPLYDLASKDIGFNIAAQIITFQYNGKEYMVETWKGDYWGAAGCEIGLYSRKAGAKRSDPYFYECAVDEPMKMKSTLSRRTHGRFFNKNKVKKLFTRDETHWWLTGFKPAEYAKPEELLMDCQIEFTDPEMARTFYKSLQGCNTATSIKKSGNVVSWSWPDGSKTEPIEKTVSDYTGGKTYDELLDKTYDELEELVLSKFR